MRLKVLILTFIAVLAFADGAECGAAVARKKPRGTIRRHVQATNAPKIHIIREPYVLEEKSVKQPQKAAVPSAKPPLPVYQAKVLSTEKPVIPLPSSASVTQDIVDLPQLVDSLQSTSQAWELIVNPEDKAIVVQEFINKFQGQGITIHKPAIHYANFIEQMSQESPRMLDLPFERILQVVTVMEYDFENGEDKETLAQKILGPQVYEKNKQRIRNDLLSGQQ